MALTQERFKRYAQIGIGAIICLIVAPIIFTVIKGGLGLLAAFVIGSIAMALMPAFSTLLTTLKFKALKVVIDHAPVEVLQGQAADLWAELAKDAETLKAQTSGVEQLKTECLKAAEEFPEEREQLEARLADREKILSFRIAQFKEAKKATEAFARTVRKAEMFYKIDVQDAELGFNKGGPDYMTRFKTETAFAAIEKAASDSRAAMRMALSGVNTVPEGTQVKGITYTEANTVNLGNILDVEAVRVRVEGNDDGASQRSA